MFDKRQRTTILAVIALACPYSAYAQAADTRPSFEVASVKPSGPTVPGQYATKMTGGPGSNDPGRVSFEHYPLSWIILSAWGLQRFQFSGPDWLMTDYGPFSPKFDIVAKIPEGTTKEQFLLMEQRLVVERFKLAFHFEKREMQVSELRVTKNGPKMTLSPTSPLPDADTGPAGTPQKLSLGNDGFPVLPPGTSMAMIGGRARMRATSESMEKFALKLTGQLQQPVTDATGLTGEYDFSLYWDAGTPSAELDSAPTLIQALQDQLGLKLESAKRKVDVLVIAHLEKMPTDK